MNTYWLIFSAGGLLLHHDALPHSEHPPIPLPEGTTLHRLPALDGCPCRAAAVDAIPLAEGYTWIGLRDTYPLLPLHHHVLAGKARELIYWDADSRFCSRCGTPMEKHTDISKRCPHCGKTAWPQLKTAIIVAVTRPETDEILLVQSRNFRGDYMGLVAGFVETGETLEECVKREVWEETHLHIKDITYFKSQPWPYPSGLMVGFKARYAGGELQLQQAELNKGGWFSRHQMPPIPGRDSLARELIEDWLSDTSHP